MFSSKVLPWVITSQLFKIAILFKNYFQTNSYLTIRTLKIVNSFTAVKAFVQSLDRLPVEMFSRFCLVFAFVLVPVFAQFPLPANGYFKLSIFPNQTFNFIHFARSCDSVCQPLFNFTAHDVKEIGQQNKLIQVFVITVWGNLVYGFVYPLLLFGDN